MIHFYRRNACLSELIRTLFKSNYQIQEGIAGFIRGIIGDKRGLSTEPLHGLTEIEN
jgi:hypothetical protein